MYKIDRENLKSEKRFCMNFFYMGLFFFIIFNYTIFGSLFGDVEATIEGNPIIWIIFSWSFTGLFMYVGLSNAKKVKEKKRIKCMII